MANRVVLNRTELQKFINLMDTITDATGSVFDSAAPRLALSGSRSDPQAAYRGGVKVTVGAVDFPHPGREAGRTMAERIAESLNFVTSLEEGARALRDFVSTVRSELDSHDSISAAELRRISDSLPANAVDPYGALKEVPYVATGGN